MAAVTAMWEEQFSGFAQQKAAMEAYGISKAMPLYAASGWDDSDILCDVKVIGGVAQPLGPINTTRLVNSPRATVTGGATGNTWACSGAAAVPVASLVSVKNAAGTAYLAYRREVTVNDGTNVTIGGGALTLAADAELILEGIPATCVLADDLIVDAVNSVRPSVFIDDGLFVAASFDAVAGMTILDWTMWPQEASDAGVHVHTEAKATIYNDAAGAESFAGAGYSYNTQDYLYAGGPYSDAGTWKAGIALVSRAAVTLAAATNTIGTPTSGDTFRSVVDITQNDDATLRHARSISLTGSGVVGTQIPIVGPTNGQGAGTTPPIGGGLAVAIADTAGMIGYKITSIEQRITTP